MNHYNLQSILNISLLAVFIESIKCLFINYLVLFQGKTTIYMRIDVLGDITNRTKTYYNIVRVFVSVVWVVWVLTSFCMTDTI